MQSFTDSLHSWYSVHHWNGKDLQVFLPAAQVERNGILPRRHPDSVDQMAHYWNDCRVIWSFSALWVSQGVDYLLLFSLEHTSQRNWVHPRC